MAKIFIDGQTFEIPDNNLTGEEIRNLASIPKEKTLYAVEEGSHTIIDDHKPTEIKDGQKIGSLSPFTAARE